jgi:hypothetical protein
MRVGLGLLAALVLGGAEAAAHTCGTSAPADCQANAGTTCLAVCTEADFRAAVEVVNQCGGDRTIRFDFGGCPWGCSIPMANQSSVASCGNDAAGAHNAVCLTGDGITIDGTRPGQVAGARFVYVGPFPCASCAGSCTGPAPALFLVKGSGNTIRRIRHAAFPEGIRINAQSGAAGADNAIRDSVFESYCEEALTINAGAGARVENNTFNGNRHVPGRTAWKERTVFGDPTQPIACTADADCTTFCSQSGVPCSDTQPCAPGTGQCAAPGQKCHCPNGWFASDPENGGSCATPGTCYRRALFGLDKAVQVNGGTDTVIAGNTFDLATRPVFVTDGNPGGGPLVTASVTGNTSTGSVTTLTLPTEPTFTVAPQNVCTGLAASHENPANAVSAVFAGNTLTLCKFGVESLDGATVVATGNTVADGYLSAFHVKGGGMLTGTGNRMRGKDPPSGTPNGGVLVETASATVDFDGAGAPNVFCGTLTDVWNGQAGAPPVAATNNCHEGTALDVVGPVTTAGSVPVGTPPCTGPFVTCDF